MIFGLSSLPCVWVLGFIGRVPLGILLKLGDSWNRSTKPLQVSQSMPCRFPQNSIAIPIFSTIIPLRRLSSCISKYVIESTFLRRERGDTICYKVCVPV